MEDQLIEADKLARLLTQFRDFLVRSWPTFQTVLQNHDWDNDAYFFEEWLDENWRLLVGRQLLGKRAGIQPFCVATNDIGKGKYQYCIRVFQPVVGTFVSMGSNGSGFSLAPPFDKVKILRDDGVEEILSFSSVSFRLCAASPSPDS